MYSRLYEFLEPQNRLYDSLLSLCPYSKLDYYVVRGTRNNGFSSYLENKFQFVSINDDSSVLCFIC